MPESFFQQINYASATEDSHAEIEALQLQSADRVLCIIASGARPLDLLTASNSTIDCVDFSGPQAFLLELKMAAYRSLSYADFRALLGLDRSDRRVEIAQSLLPQLSLAARQFWERHPKLIKFGLLYCGTWEKLLRWISKTTIFRRRHVNGLLNSTDLETQILYWNRHWNGPFLRRFLRLLSNRFLWTQIIREPGAKLIPRDFDVSEYLFQALNQMAHHSLLRQNPYANLLFYGRYTDQCELPLHLEEQNFQTIRDRLGNINIFISGLEEHLAQTEHHYSAYSLSDFSSYANRTRYESTWKAILSRAERNARFCERHFLVKHDMQDARIIRDRALEEKISAIDHTCLYTFHAGRIVSNVGE